MTRVHEPGPLFGDRWPDPPEPEGHWGPTVRVRPVDPQAIPSVTAYAVSAVEAPKGLSTGPIGSVPRTPAQARKQHLEDAYSASVAALDSVIVAVGWLGVVDEDAAASHRKAIDGAQALVGELAARLGR